MTQHDYWGTVEPDWAGFSSDITFAHPTFGDKEVEIFLGDEFDDDGEEVDAPPSATQLTELAATYQAFTAQLDQRLAELEERAFAYYRAHYADFYEDAAQSGEPPRGIDSVEKHRPFIQDLAYLRVSAGQIIRFPIHYDLDSEHGLEVKFVNNEIADVGGLAET